MQNLTLLPLLRRHYVGLRFPAGANAQKRIAVYATILALAGIVGGYAIQEYRAARRLAAENVQTTTALNATRQELSDLTAKVNMLASRNETQSVPSIPSAHTAPGARPSGVHQQREDPRYKSCNRRSTHRGRRLTKPAMS